MSSSLGAAQQATLSSRKPNARKKRPLFGLEKRTPSGAKWVRGRRASMGGPPELLRGFPFRCLRTRSRRYSALPESSRGNSQSVAQPWHRRKSRFAKIFLCAEGRSCLSRCRCSRSTQNPPDCYRGRREPKAGKKRGGNGDLLLPIASARTLRFRGMARETGRARNMKGRV
jgi:hypothetical protein